LGLNWLCFFAASIHKILHKPLLLLTLRHFIPPVNWLCFFKLVSILLTILPLFVVLSALFGVFSHILLIDRFQFLIFTLWFYILHFDI